MADSEQQALALTLSGRVQGVGFRWFTLKAAQELGITGWVRNEPDGTVLIHAIGSFVAMDAFRDKVRQGPMFGRVDKLVETPLENLPTYVDFRVTYS